MDTDATRSFHIDQSQMVRQAFPQYGAVFASNFHSAYLAYPFHEMHGSVQAGLLTLSRYAVAQAERRSYPVDESFPTKFFDLDRCFSIQRLSVAGGGELVLINSHMSAYDEGGTVRAAQLELLGGVLREEREKGNYVIVGGDFNHALCGTVQAFASGQQIPAWVFEFSDSDLPEGFHVVEAENLTEVPTCRSSDMPYTPGVNYTAVLDGFIVSDNLTGNGAERGHRLCLQRPQPGAAHLCAGVRSARGKGGQQNSGRGETTPRAAVFDPSLIRRRDGPGCSGRSRSNSLGMATRAARPTMVKTIRLKIEAVPPKSQPTQSKRNRPTSPQLRPPMISSARHIFLIISQFLHRRDMARQDSRSCP